jgi:myosin heavy chain 6/7
LAEERENAANIQKKVKQLQYHLTEAEEQISEQKSLRARAEKHNEELTHEIKELLAEVDEVSAAELSASSLRKKAEQETNNLRREMAEAAKRADMAYAQLKKKHDEAVTEMGRQIESLIKAKSK